MSVPALVKTWPDGSGFAVAEWLFPVEGPALRWAGLHWNRFGVIEAVWALTHCPTVLRPYLPEQAALAGTCIVPGFINTHCHLEQWRAVPLPKAAEESFDLWLRRVVEQQREERLTEGGQQQAVARSINEGIATGTTCFADISAAGASVTVAEALGVRLLLALELIWPFPLVITHPQNVPERLQHFLQQAQTVQALQQQHAEQAAHQGRLPLWLLGLSPHSVYNVSPSAYRYVVSQLQPRWFHWHLAECKEEQEWLTKHEGSVLANLHRALLGQAPSPEWSEPTQNEAVSLLIYWQKAFLAAAPASTEEAQHHVLAHGSVMEASLWSQLAQQGNATYGLAHCPRSNLALHGQTLAYHEAAPTFPGGLGLGTDGRLSTPDLDLRREALAAKALHGWNWEQTLQVLTLDGAQALGQQGVIGSLVTGKQADFTVWQLENTNSVTSQDAIASVLQQAEGLMASYVQGKMIN